MPYFCYGNINLGCSSHVIVLLLQKKWQILNLNPNLKFVLVRRGNHARSSYSMFVDFLNEVSNMRLIDFE